MNRSHTAAYAPDDRIIAKPVGPSETCVGPLPDDAAHSLRPVVLRKSHVREITAYVRSRMHHIYALWDGAPVYLFHIKRVYSYRDARSAEMRGEAVFSFEPEIYSLREYRERRASFHRYDEFEIHFHLTDFRTADEVSAGAITEAYRLSLTALCESAILRNSPIVLTRDACRRHGLTRTDADIVRPMIEQINDSIKRRLRTLYDMLGSIDCIRDR